MSKSKPENPVKKPPPRSASSGRVIWDSQHVRGGGVDEGATPHAMKRYGHGPSDHYRTNGFRLARTKK